MPIALLLAAALSQTAPLTPVSPPPPAASGASGSIDPGGAIFGWLAVVALYAVVRKLPRTWWIWGTAVAVALLAFGSLIAPVLIVPLFNNPKRLEDQRVVAPILSLARANGIRAGEVWEI